MVCVRVGVMVMGCGGGYVDYARKRDAYLTQIQDIKSQKIHGRVCVCARARVCVSVCVHACV